MLTDAGSTPARSTNLIIIQHINTYMHNKDNKLIWESYRDKDPRDFKLSEQDYTQAEEQLNGLRLSKFIEKHADELDTQKSVVIKSYHIQKHYGKVHVSERSPTPGDSIRDAVLSLGGVINIDNVSQDEEMGRPGYIIKDDQVMDDPEEIDRVRRARDHQSRDMARWRHD